MNTELISGDSKVEVFEIIQVIVQERRWEPYHIKGK